MSAASGLDGLLEPLSRCLDAESARRIVDFQVDPPVQERIDILAEGANGPTTSAADDVLTDKGVFVIPDILANAGGVTTSYFEWVQDRQGYFWNEQLVNGRLEEIMVNSFKDVVGYAEKHKVHNRLAAYMLAIDRVAFALQTRGIYA